MRVLSLLCILLVAGCDTPSAHFRGIPPARITVEGSTFDVRQRGTLVEAVRINPQYAPRLGPLRHRARRAMAASTGCRVLWVSGDQAVLVGRLSCP